MAMVDHDNGGVGDYYDCDYGDDDDNNCDDCNNDDHMMVMIIVIKMIKMMMMMMLNILQNDNFYFYLLYYIILFALYLYTYYVNIFICRKDGFNSVSEAVGIDHKQDNK